MASRNEKGATAAGMTLSKPIDDRVKNHMAAPLIATDASAAPKDHCHGHRAIFAALNQPVSTAKSSNGKPAKSRSFISHKPSDPNITNGTDEPT